MVASRAGLSNPTYVPNHLTWAERWALTPSKNMVGVERNSPLT
jgi:hypothetical protein